FPSGAFCCAYVPELPDRFGIERRRGTNAVRVRRILCLRPPAIRGRPVLDDLAEPPVARDVPGGRRAALAAAFDDVAQAHAQVLHERLLPRLIEPRREREVLWITRLQVIDNPLHESVVIQRFGIDLHGERSFRGHRRWPSHRLDTLTIVSGRTDAGRGPLMRHVHILTCRQSHRSLRRYRKGHRVTNHTPPRKTVTLDNGLTLFLQEKHDAPVVSFWTWYRVGSRNELPGLTGVSHWVEHMQFKG